MGGGTSKNNINKKKDSQEQVEQIKNNNDKMVVMESVVSQQEEEDESQFQNNSLIINENIQNNFQPHKSQKPEKGFRIRESRASFLQVDDDEEENCDVSQRILQNDSQTSTKIRRKKMSSYYQLVQQSQQYKQRQNSIPNNNEIRLFQQQNGNLDQTNQNIKSKQQLQNKIGQNNFTNNLEVDDLSDNDYLSTSSTNPRRNGSTRFEQIYSPVKLQKKAKKLNKMEQSPMLEKSRQGLVGLINIGNTCFMSQEKGMAKSYAELIQKIRKVGNSGAENTKQLKKSIEMYSLQFAGNSQQDSHELLVTLLDGLHEELNKGKKPKYKELSADIKKNKLQQISDEWFNYYKIQDDSHIQDYFRGQLLSKVICTQCKNESLAFDNFQDLSLSFSRGIRMVDDPQIERLFQWYLQEENLDDEYYCSKCKSHRKCSRKLTLWKLPNILVLHLKRFHYGRTKREKINQKIKFPIKNLDLSNYVNDSDDPTTENAVYDLVGIVNHTGNLYGGHYTAECQNQFDKRWYNFNDSSVQEINIQQQEYETYGASQPYILFYSKQQ